MIGGIYLASYVPRTVPLAPAVVLLVISVAILAANVVMLRRIPEFAWNGSFRSFSGSLLAYTSSPE